MTRVFAITNQKGGVGKTTTTINLAASLAATGQRVLLIDLDPQGNATMGVGVDKYACEQSVYDVLLEGTPVADVAISVLKGEGIEHLDVLPSNMDLASAELELADTDTRERTLTEVLGPVRDRYDFILLDCPPSLSLLTLNALCVADGVIIPVQCEYYALEGLTALLETIRRVTEAANPDLKVEGILRTMYDNRASLTRDVSRQLIDHFGDLVYRTVIPRNVRLAEAPSHGLPILLYERYSRGAVAYLALAGEVMRRCSVEIGQTN